VTAAEGPQTTGRSRYGRQVRSGCPLGRPQPAQLLKTSADPPGKTACGGYGVHRMNGSPLLMPPLKHKRRRSEASVTSEAISSRTDTPLEGRQVVSTVCMLGPDLITPSALGRQVQGHHLIQSTGNTGAGAGRGNRAFPRLLATPGVRSQGRIAHVKDLPTGASIPAARLTTPQLAPVPACAHM
jgi:hypothetical protein